MTRIARWALLCVSVLNLWASDEADSAVKVLPRHVLTNQGIVALAEAGYDEAFLIDLILYKQTRFDTTVEGLTFLADNGISKRIVRYMIANENKSPGFPVTPAPPAAEPTARPAVTTPARLSRLKGPVPETNDPQSGPYVVAKHHLFWNRWYVVNPAPIPAAPPTTARATDAKLSPFPAF